MKGACSDGCATVVISFHDSVCFSYQVVCDAVVSPDVCDTESADNQEQLLCLVEIITSKSGEQCAQYSLQLFIVVLHVMSLQREGMLDEKVGDVFF